MRSGTLDVPGAVGLATATAVAVERRAEARRAARGAARRAGRRRAARLVDSDVVVNGAPGRSRLPGNAHLSFPGCEGDSLLMLLDARGIECSTGSACSAGVAQPSHVLLAMGADADAARGSLRFSLGHTSTADDVDAALDAHRPGRRAGPPRRPAPSVASCGCRPMRVLAAMSGGVDSAVAAARAVDAGHDVTGVHLALSRSPGHAAHGARGCCTVEDAQRRAPGGRRARHPVLRLGPRRAVPRRRGRRLRRRVRRRPHPEPVPALQREDQVRGGARPGARARLRRGRHRAPRPARSTAGCAARSTPAKDQSYVLAVLDRRAARARDVPARRLDQGRRCAPRPRARGLAVADKPDSHDICFIADGDTRGFLAAAARRAGRRPIVDADDRRRCSARTTARTASPSASAAA